MAYDILGNYVTDDDSDTPVVNEQQETQQEIRRSAVGAVAPAQAAPTPVAPQPQQTGPVAPQPAQPQQPQQPPARPQAPVAPKPPEPITRDPYNAYTARNESGSNPNIGYHMPGSTAYGTYGITAAAYKDIQAMDPSFKDRPITSLSPEEQDRANLTYRTVLGKQLAAQGVEPTEANTRLAHFMGAKGAGDYLKTGAISPQAAAANGGIDKVRAIAEGRLAGDAAPASGASDYARQFVQATQNPKQLSAIRNDENAPVGFRQAAAAQDLQNLQTEKAKMEAQQKFQTIAQTGDWSALGKELKSQSESGSIFKAMFYKQAGLNELAMAEQQKIGAGRTWQNIDLADGTQGVVQVGLDGLPVQGYTATGPMDAMQLEQAVGMGAGGGKADYVGGSVINDQTGMVGRIVSKNNRTMIESGGRLYPPTAQWRNNTVGTDVNAAYNKSYYGAQGTEQGKGAGQGLTPGATVVAPGAPQGVAGNGPAQQGMMPQPGGQAPQQPMQPGGPVQPGQAQPMPQGATQQQQPMPQQQAPQQQQSGPYRGAIVNPQAAPAGAPQGGLEQQRQNLAVNETERKDFVEKVAPELTTKADQGRQVADVRRRQLDLLTKTPELAGILQGQGPASTEAMNIVRDVIAGKISKDDEEGLTKRINALNLSQTQKDALYNLAAENLKVLPLTLKSNAGPGTISEAEHKINREANVDPTRVPVYTAFSMLSRDQFDKDLQAYRNDWGVATGQQTRRAESSNWAVEQRQLDTAYNNIYKARAEYISKYGSTPAAVVDAFKYYPNPVYDPQSKSFQYSGYSAQAAQGRPSLSSFNK